MGSVRARPDTGTLYLDFRYRGRRCREQTGCADTPVARRALERQLDRMTSEIKSGTFDYAAYFPDSRMAARLASENAPPPIPTFAEFAATWVRESEVTWRRTQRRTVNDILNRHLLPAFATKRVSDVRREEILAFRAVLASRPGRTGETLSPKRINSVMGPLRQVLNEAAVRFCFPPAFQAIKPLRIPKADVRPFSLDEVQTLLASVRPDFKNYYTVRFFTGMRTGEIDGLKWRYVDFERRQILVKETRVAGRTDITKTDGSDRAIDMSGPVFDALQAQRSVSQSHGEYVFCNCEGGPLDHDNVTKRVWYPLLDALGFERRRPSQTRHTAATLWLASGENPQWIARQLGHTTTELLFKVYARYVPNVTRKDGSAFEHLLSQRFGTSPTCAR